MIEVTVHGSLAKEEYPRLKRSISNHERVVLFTDNVTGTVINDGKEGYEKGDWSNSWEPTSFEDFPGEITLKNM